MVFKPSMGFVSSNYVEDKKKLNPFRVHFMRLFVPTLAHFARQRGAFKSTTRTELQIWETTIHIINIKLLRVQLVPSCLFVSRLLSCHIVIMMKQ